MSAKLHCINVSTGSYVVSDQPVTRSQQWGYCCDIGKAGNYFVITPRWDATAKPVTAPNLRAAQAKAVKMIEEQMK